MPPIPKQDTPHEVYLPDLPEHCYAFVRKDLRFSRNGMAEVVLQIPWQYRQYAMYLLDQTGNPMEITIKPCRPTLKSL